MPAAFRIYPSFQTFFSDDGTLLAGGSLRFYESGTATPKDVYGEKALSTNNGSTIDLDAAGRPEHPIWGSGQYDVHLYDADNVKVGEDLTVEIPGGEATALPALSAAKFLTNDGSVMSWAEIEQVPDPTGSANKILGTDGTTVSWVDRPADGTSDVSQTATSFSVENMLCQFGSATANASGAATTNKAVTFGTAYSTAPKVFLAVTSGQQPGGPLVSYFSAAATTTGFTAYFDVAEGSSSGANVVNDVTFDWIAFGVTA